MPAQGATRISRNLAHNASLTSLDLGLNKIGPDGASALCEALAGNSTLTHLNLGTCWWVHVHTHGYGMRAEQSLFRCNNAKIPKKLRIIA